jgi:hypothetical protein
VIFKKIDDVIARQIAGETLLVPIRGELADMQKIFALNPVAEYIWQQLDGRQSLAQISQGLLARFEVAEEQAEADLAEFIAELLAAGLIVEVA